MLYIKINGIVIELTTNVNISDVTTKAKNDFVDYNNTLDNEIWNKDCREMEYNVKLSNSELWYLYQIFINSSIITIGDRVFGKSIVSFIINISEKYNFNDYEKPWDVTFIILSLSETEYNDGDYLGFEYTYDINNDEYIGFEKTEDDTVGFERTFI
jgi:hypothetical protein